MVIIGKRSTILINTCVISWANESFAAVPELLWDKESCESE